MQRGVRVAVVEPGFGEAEQVKTCEGFVGHSEKKSSSILFGRERRLAKSIDGSGFKIVDVESLARRLASPFSGGVYMLRIVQPPHSY